MQTSSSGRGYIITNITIMGVFVIIWIRGVMYNAEKENVGILLTDSDKKNIVNMHPDNNCYLAGPKGMFTKERAEKIGNKLKQRGRSVKSNNGAG